MLDAHARPEPEFQAEYEDGEDAPGEIPGENQHDPERILWAVLSAAPSKGIPVREIITATGMSLRLSSTGFSSWPPKGFAVPGGTRLLAGPRDRLRLRDCRVQSCRCTPRACLHVLRAQHPGGGRATCTLGRGARPPCPWADPVTDALGWQATTTSRRPAALIAKASPQATITAHPERRIAGAYLASGPDSHGHQCRYRRAFAVHLHHLPASRSIHPGIRAMVGRYRAEMPAGRIAGTRTAIRARCADDNANGPDRALPGSRIPSCPRETSQNSGTARPCKSERAVPPIMRLLSRSFQARPG